MHNFPLTPGLLESARENNLLLAPAAVEIISTLKSAPRTCKMYIYIHLHIQTQSCMRIYIKQKDRRALRKIYNREYTCVWLGYFIAADGELPSVKSQRVVLRGVVALAPAPPFVMRSPCNLACELRQTEA